jgi:hypothetical protein
MLNRYPGYDIYVDPSLKPAQPRIAYGVMSTSPVADTASKDLACNTPHNPIPGAIAEVRAGSNVTLQWSRWLYSHKGPITAWMAPYDGNISSVDVNALSFFKIYEDIMDANGTWGTVRMMDVTNMTVTVTIPADIKPGNYILRQELIALHFALRVPPALQSFNRVGPQFYPHCVNLKVTGSGTATPAGVKFPGGYNANDPGLKYDVYANNTPALPFPPLGPAVYKSATTLHLDPKPLVQISPTGQGADQDAAYFAKQNQVLAAQATTVEYFDSIGG